MKNYMMLFLGATYEELGLSPEQMQDRMGKWFSWGAKMKEKGQLVGGEALHANGKRITGPSRTVTDGPFVESKELVGGYYIVTAEKVEDVQEIAQDYPDYDLGGAVEIREVIVFNR